MNDITRLFPASDGDDSSIRIKNAFKSVVRNSTWYSCQEISSPFTDEELSQIAVGMIYYVTTRADILYDNENVLGLKLLECRIGILDLAAGYSSDFLYEAAHAAPRERSLTELRELRDRMTAACLFFYKHCCTEEKLFSVSWISKWLRISSMLNHQSGAKECSLDALLRALEGMEAWTDEIQAMKAGQ